MFRVTCLAMFWRHCGGTSCSKQFHSITYLATAKIVARQVARKVGLSSTFGNGSCNLSCNDFARCKVYYTLKCFVQLVPPQCRQNIARQVARNISQRNSAHTKIACSPAVEVTQRRERVSIFIQINRPRNFGS